MIPTSRIPAALRTFLVGLLLVPGLLAASTPAKAVSDVVISQVYGGGGSLYTHDFIELHNRGTAPVVVSGWSVQFSEPGAATWEVTVLNGSIPAGGYYLVRGIAGAGGGAPLPAIDQIGSLSINAVAGKVALVNKSNQLVAPPLAPNSGVLDLFGYGAANMFEGAPMPPLNANLAAFRDNFGCEDTDNNANDFTAATPAPRNSASPLFQCQFTLTYLAGPNGSISGTTPQTVAHGANGSPVTAVPNPGYHFVSWSDGVLTAARTDMNVVANITATATFAITEHTLTYFAGQHGTISGTTPQTVPDGGNGTQVTAVPDLGYHFVSWSDGGLNASRTELNVTADLTVTASFEINQYTLTYSAGVGGTISGTTPQTVPHGGTGTAVTAVANPGRHFVKWSDNVATATRTDGPVTADLTVIAEFALNVYTLTYNAGPGGTISGTTPQTVPHGGSGSEVTAVPNVGYHFVKWSDDLATAKRTDSPVTADLTVTAQFAEKKVVVSQIYGGGGETGATLTHDFVELFNQGEFAVDIKDWTVQYTSATGTTWTTTPLDGVIQPHSYILVQQAAGGGGSAPLPVPVDATGTTNLDAFAGKVALVSSLAALSGSCPTGDPIEDMVGYGSADCSETSPALSPTNTTGALRKFRGCIDTDNNSADFIAGTPDPRNSASPVNTCTFTLTVVVSPPGSGTVTASPNQVTFAAGAPVQLTAAPSLNPPAYHFDHWSGVNGGSVNPLTFNMDSDKTVTAHFVSNTSAGQIVISQFFGGGGDQPTGLKNDYVELYNRGNGPVSVGGWSVQFAAASSTVWNLTPLSGNIPAGKYLLVKCFAGGSGTVDLIPADVVGALDVGATAGKLALVSNAVPLTGQSCPSPGPGIVDFVGYGVANCSETSPAGATSVDEAGFRDNGGCEETNNNLADFSNGAPSPRNSATPAHFCDIWLDAGTTPVALALSPPMPNPSRGRFNFSLGLPVEGEVRVTISDIQGRRIASLVDGRLPAGRHNLSWTGVGDAGPVRSGLYYLALEHQGQRMVRRFVIVR